MPHQFAYKSCEALEAYKVGIRQDLCGALVRQP